MSKGLNQQDIQKSKLVTIDLEYKNNEHFKKFPFIIRIQGNSLDKRTVKKVMPYFDDSIDLIFIDSVHEYKHV